MRAGQNARMREVQHDDRVLAAGEQQHRSLALGGDLADDGDRLVLELGGRRRASVAVIASGQVYRKPDRSRIISSVDDIGAIVRTVGRPAGAARPSVASSRSGVPSCCRREAQRGAALELAELAPRRAADDVDAVAGQLGDDRPDEVAPCAPVRVTSVGSQPVLAMPTSTRHVSPPRSDDRGVADLEARRGQRLGDGELGVRRDLGAQQVGGGFVQIAEVVPAAELDRAELRVVERVPVDVAARVVLVAPAQHGERLVVGRAEVPEVGRLLVCRSPRGRRPRTRSSSANTPRCS